jgi:hypothetical protein
MKINKIIVLLVLIIFTCSIFVYAKSTEKVKYKFVDIKLITDNNKTKEYKDDKIKKIKDKIDVMPIIPTIYCQCDTICKIEDCLN